MRTGLPHVVVVACLLIAQGARSLAAEIRAPVVPEFSDKPAVGLEMRCSPQSKTYKVGDEVVVFCTIANVSEETKPIVWGHIYSQFWFQRGERILGGGGVGFNASFPKIKTPVSVRSADPNGFLGDEWGLVFGLPPGGTLRFTLQPSPSGKATEARHHRGRFVYSPKPRSGVGGVWA